MNIKQAQLTKQLDCGWTNKPGPTEEELIPGWIKKKAQLSNKSLNCRWKTKQAELTKKALNGGWKNNWAQQSNKAVNCGWIS